MKILLTGFEPFNGSSHNPSAKVIEHFPIEQFSDHSIKQKILMVDTVKAVEWIKDFLIEEQPDIVIHLGEASSRAVVSIEKVAINWMDFRIADNSGKQVLDKKIFDDGPDAFFSTLPVNQIYSEIKAAGIPVEISLSAGAFLCNQVFYSSMYYLSQIKKSQCGFIHLPPLPEQIVEKNQNSPSMSYEMSLQAIIVALQTCINNR
jgi:pyroglutamyl-peptidase